MNKTMKRILTGILVFVILLGAGAGVYLSDYYRADADACAALASGDGYTVTVTKDLAIFSPSLPDAGFIFYPGGKVEYTAYAPLMAELAKRNILCVIPRMPGNLAVLNSDAASGIPEQYPQVERWYIGGHSLGGSMAAAYLADHPETYSGLILLASYSTSDLSGSCIPVLSLVGSEDGVLNRESYGKYHGNLPDNTTEIVLEGGNHAFFGSYGPQDGDGDALLSPREQTVLTAEYILKFLS